ncbi:MAG: M28 family peptidase [Desulfuromusa sp.]|nr:M28 family peptidase [Desulfuromusa sp.]
MMKILKSVLWAWIICSLFVFNYAQSTPRQDMLVSVTSDEMVKNSLRAHIEFLADDLLQGRNTGSEEYEIAARYVASHFRQYGLKVAGENNSWFQSVPFIRSTVEQSSQQMILHTANNQTEFKSPKEFVSLAGVTSAIDEVRGKLVFVGYGIVSKGMKHNDYGDLDVQGKIVVMFAGRPASYPSEEGAHISNIREKLRHAANRGAIGVITLDRHIPSFASRPLINWKMKEGGVFDSYPGLQGIAFATMDAGRQIFSAAGYDVEQVFAQARENDLSAGFDMDVEVSLIRKSTHEALFSSNVVGILEGSDPVLKNEYVVYSAHLDHIGVNTQGVDLINNGALDNAAGIAIMLETARRFSLGQRPKRSILFVAVTAEEHDLLGSNYFAHYPTVPVDSMVANINLDMPVILYPFADVVAFGAQHSTLADNVRAAARTINLRLSPDPIPEQAIFTHADHYSFVKQGVPSVYLVPGFTSKDPSINGGQVFGEYYSKHYHQPSDDISLPIDYKVGASFTTINFLIGEDIANSPLRPRWNEGDFFGDMFKKTARNMQ